MALNRTQILRSLFDTSGFGLEVGPSYNPLLPKSKGYNVEIVDHADAQTLREKYSDNASQIEEVDYVSDGRGLAQLIGKPNAYDFILASHVIEHVTDIIGFINDCSALLKPAGVLVLAVPDKRFCFDVLRPVSTVGQALQAYIEKRTRHTPGTLFDYRLSISKKRGSIVWRETNMEGLELVHSPQDAKNIFESSRTSTQYNDVHGWQFTPSYFRYFIKTLRSLGYINMGEKEFVKKYQADLPLHEFYITLSKTAPGIEISDLELLKSSESELRQIKTNDGLTPIEAELATKSKQLADREREIAVLKDELGRATASVEAISRSTSWKLTAPLRYLKMLAR